MKKVIAIASAILLAGTSLHAQTTEDSVKQVVTTMFQAMLEADSAKAVSTFWDGAVMQTIIPSKQGGDSVRTDSFQRFASSIGRQQKGALDERIQFGQVLIDQSMAVVWTPYQFYLKGQFSHCGVNCFQLVRINGLWKINHIIDTRRKTGCN